MFDLAAAREYRHRAEIEPDNGEPVTFKWHWPRGTFEKRMSGYELAAFVLPHMPAILPLLTGHPRIRLEFEAMLVLLATSPRAAIDEVLPWIRPVLRTETDDIIEMQIGSRVEQSGPVHFVQGVECPL